MRRMYLVLALLCFSALLGAAMLAPDKLSAGGGIFSPDGYAKPWDMPALSLIHI